MNGDINGRKYGKLVRKLARSGRQEDVMGGQSEDNYGQMEKKYGRNKIHGQDQNQMIIDHVDCIVYHIVIYNA